MRDLFLGPLLFAILLQTFRTPSAGVLGWTWLTLMTPQKLIWGFLTGMPLNLILALATLAMVVFTPDKRKPPLNVVIGLWTTFTVIVTISTLSAMHPQLAWETWSRVVKVMLLGLLVPALMTTPRRVHALIWIIVISLGYFGVKGGLFTLMFASGGHVVGPPDSQLIDNNNLALALCLTLPLMNYLRLQAPGQLVRLVLLISMVATAFGVLGTYSRGGFIGLGVMAGYLWWRSKHRIALALAIIAVVVPALLMMPQSWYQRMGTLKEASSQQTFQTRLDAWKVNWNIAVARPLTGGGFNASEDPDTYRIYSYGKSIYAGPGTYKTPAGFTGGHAAHSIYLEVLGDHGFIGLGIYLAMLIATWSLLGRVRKSSKGLASLEWVEELATMVQVSFVAFFVSGFALSMAYYDLVFLFMGITLALSVVVGDFKEDARAAVVPSRVPDAVKRGKWRAPALNPT